VPRPPSTDPADPADPVRPAEPTRPAELARWWTSLPPRAGGTTVLALEGRSGSGKTVLAAALARQVPTAQVVAMDEVYPGWDGLAASIPLLVDRVLRPLSRGEPATVPRWDWTADRPGPPRPLPATRFLLVEGIGSGARAGAPHLSGIVWLEAPADVRRRRALARDGETYAPHWDRWAAQEEAYLRSDDPRSRAAAVLRGAGS
jgi:uridine kinase